MKDLARFFFFLFFQKIDHSFVDFEQENAGWEYGLF